MRNNKGSMAVAAALSAGLALMPVAQALANDGTLDEKTPDGTPKDAGLPLSPASEAAQPETAAEAAPTAIFADQGASPAAEPRSAALTDGDYYNMVDNYPSFTKQLETAKAQKKAGFRLCTGVTDGGTISIPESLTEFVGYEKSFFSNAIKTRQLGYWYDLQVKFPAKSNITVDHIDFYKANINQPDVKGSTVTVEEGAVVRFKDCSFSNTPVVNGTAVFENCTFATGEINNNGTATYTGTTKEPKNIGTPKTTYQDLALSLAGGKKTFDAAVEGETIERNLSFEVKGTKAKDAKITASIDHESGLTVSVSGNKVSVSGKAAKAGTYTVNLSAATTRDDGSADTATEALSLSIQAPLDVKLEGALQCFTTKSATPTRSAASANPVFTVASASPVTFDALSSASGGGGGGTSNTNTNKLVLAVKEGKGSYVSILDFMRAHPETKVSFSISPEGSGMNASLVYDTVYVNGTPAKSGTYQITATVSEGARKVSSNAVEMRIYDNDKNLAQRIADQATGKDSWDMEPYDIAHTGNAVIPTSLRHIYGSHESGVYGTIGMFDKTDPKLFASETLTVPAGADVTISNMKISSTVKIVVEAGGKLTLDDSVAFGPVEVHGTLSTTEAGATVTDEVTLHDGGVLYNANIKSHANYLTDGSYRKAPKSPVVVAGSARVTGKTSITGEGIVSSKDGQTGLVLNPGASLEITQGSTLEVTGGEVEMHGGNGGAGVEMGEGSAITGAGKLIATGGRVKLGEGDGGAGIAGSGTVDVATLVSTGGAMNQTGVSLGGGIGKGGAGVAPDVKVSYKTDATVTNGGSATPGTSEYSIFGTPSADEVKAAVSVKVTSVDGSVSKEYAPIEGSYRVTDAVRNSEGNFESMLTIEDASAYAKLLSKETGATYKVDASHMQAAITLRYLPVAAAHASSLSAQGNDGAVSAAGAVSSAWTAVDGKQPVVMVSLEKAGESPHSDSAVPGKPGTSTPGSGTDNPSASDSKAPEASASGSETAQPPSAVSSVKASVMPSTGDSTQAATAGLVAAVLATASAALAALRRRAK